MASYVLQINFYLGAGAWGLVSALLINSVARRRKIGADAAIGIVTTASFAVGVALVSRVHRFTVNFDAALFGICSRWPSCSSSTVSSYSQRSIRRSPIPTG